MGSGYFHILFFLSIGVSYTSQAMQFHPLQKIASAESYMSPEQQIEILESQLALLHAQSPDPGTADKIEKIRTALKGLEVQLKYQENERKKIKYLVSLFPGENRDIEAVNRERGNSSDSSSDDATLDDGKCP